MTTNQDDLQILKDLASVGAAYCKLPGGSKAPDYQNWQVTKLPLDTILAHVGNGGGVGLLTGQMSGGLCLIDLDGKLTEFLQTFSILARAPRIVRKHADRGKILVFVQNPPVGRKWHRGINGPIEFLSTGQQGVLPPSIHPSGEPYLWSGESTVPVLSERDLRRIIEEWTGTPWPAPGEGPQGVAESDRVPSLEELELVINTLPDTFADDYETWRDVGMALHSAHDSSEGCDLWDRWSKQSDKWKRGTCKATWKTFGEYVGTPVTWRSLFWWAEEAKIVEMMGTGKPSSLSSPTRTKVAELVESGAFPASDVGLGELFAQLYDGQVKYVPTHGWFIWNGKVWEPDHRLSVYRKAFALYKSALREINKALILIVQQKAQISKMAGDAIDLQTAATKIADITIKEKSLSELKSAVIKLGLMPKLEAALKAAQAQSNVIATIDDFDTDPWIMAVLNGDLNLRTKELTAHNPISMCSKLANVIYDPKATAPTWERFITDICLERRSDGSREYSDELAEFIQTCAGYSLQGLPMRDADQVFFFCFGAGSNGKSTFVGTIAEILGTYAATIRPTALMIQYGHSQAEDVAHLAGIRLAVCPELPAGSKMDESAVKSLTGDSIVRARHLYKSSFEFVPKAKLWMHGNHRPEIRDAGEGMWRRLVLLPFEARFGEESRDTTLPAKLLEETSGILNWLLVGFDKWYSGRLVIPGYIKTAVQEYREDENRFEQFLDEYCDWDLNGRVIFKDLYAVYKNWCENNSEVAVRPKTFSAQIELYARAQEYRLGKTRIGNAKGFQGLKLTEEAVGLAKMLTINQLDII